MSFAKDVWQNLSAIDVSARVEKKAGLSYLSWAWAWGVLMQEYPESSIDSIAESVYDESGTVMVVCTVTVRDGEKELARTMWLPVMDNKNHAVANPDARKVSDARMRCLVKCLALFGLGHYIYAGEDLPSEAVPAPVARIDDDKVNWVRGALADTGSDEAAFAAWVRDAFGVASITEVTVDQWPRLEAAIEKKLSTYAAAYATSAAPERGAV